MTNVVHNDCGQYKPLLAVGDRLYASKGYDLLVSSDGGNTFRTLAVSPNSRYKNYIAGSRLYSRISREGFHSLARSSDGAIVAVARGAIAYCPSGAAELENVLSIERGSRPLNVCWTPGDGFYFGEYYSNPGRESVHIFGSEDGRDWSVVYTFSPGSIRHVHGIYYDRFRNGVWVLTGDTDEESGLWFTNDKFSNLEPVVSGGQNTRAVTILAREDGLIVPMDSPITRNYIQHLDPDTGRFTQLAELPGSSFHATCLDELMLVSTVVEPSTVNRDQRVALFAGSRINSWQCIGRYTRDYPAHLDRYLQYPGLALVPAEHASSYAFAYATGLKGLDGCCLRWSSEDIRNALGNDTCVT